MRVIQIGNLAPSHSTESHLQRALMANGIEVISMQENEPKNWLLLAEPETYLGVDFVLWTRTGWDWKAYGVTEEWATVQQHKMLLTTSRLKIPTVGYHLDIWWGLRREHQVHEEPFFWVDLLVTADGGHDAQWAEAGINHVWFPPAVSLPETEPGRYREELASDIVFVGSWLGHYHEESKHRFELVNWLGANFRSRTTFWPKVGEPAIRGRDLTDLYASCKLAVGDSCFTGTDLANYWSDRIPETLGRGCYLLHPWVSGLSGHYPEWWADQWSANNWDRLGYLIEYYLANHDQRSEDMHVLRAHTIAHHTYERRMAQLIDLLIERKLLKRPKARK